MNDAFVTDLIASQFGISKVKALVAERKIKSLLNKLPAEIRESPAAQLWVTLYAVGGTELIRSTSSDLTQIVDAEDSNVPTVLMNVLRSFIDDGPQIAEMVGADV